VQAGQQSSLSQAYELPAQALVPAAEEVAWSAALLRAVDLLAASTMLLLLLPVFLVIAVAIRLDSSGPVFFRQTRCGRGRREFMINKFRTMRCDAVVDPHRRYVLGLIDGTEDMTEPGLYKLRADDRVTRVGRFLRRFSLDELPQLWNVLRGHMTLVGPRPPIPYEVDNYPPDWLGRLAVKPGLTGLWQVSGRAELSYNEMVQLDLEYVKNRSLLLNARILAKTIWVVLGGRGAV
jgi:lipopolysaccharide/colanic/teichoic acid biosynthesis glycosyltransferase